jgi:hypothetical protein
MTHRTPHFRRSQRGAAVLVVSLILLFGLTLVAFFANRTSIFEQRTSSNQYRSTRAFEMAEAGIEWATTRLNETIAINATAPAVCSDPGGANITDTFRVRYLVPQITPTPGFNVPTANPPRVGCSISATGATTCSCPTAGVAPVLGPDTEPRFTVQFNPVAGDATAVEIVSRGCTGGTTCDSADSQEAAAVVRVLLKVVPQFPNTPGAGLITGGSAVPGGNLRVVNTDIKSNGVTINSGTVVDLTGSTSVTTLAGTPPRASVLDQDESLQALTAADADGDLFFRGFFGMTMDAYQRSPQTWYIKTGSCNSAPNPSRCTSCGSAAACGTAVSDAYNNKVTQFWSDADLQFGTGNLPSVGTLGTATLPITIAGSGHVELRSNMVAYGMFYAATATATENWDYSGSGSAKVFGAFVSRGDFVKGTGTLDLIYDPNVFGGGSINGLFARVPGSWRDKLTEF